MNRRVIAQGIHDDHGMSKDIVRELNNPSTNVLNKLDEFVDKYPELFETQVSVDEVAEAMGEDVDFITDVFGILAQELPNLSDYDAPDVEYSYDKLCENEGFLDSLARLVIE